MDSKTKDMSEILGSLADLLGVLGFIFFIKFQIDGMIENVKLPKEMNFYLLFFWAFVAAFLGGFVWNVLNQLNEHISFMGPTSPYIGGTQSEPHGIAAILWPVSTLFPMLITLLALNWKYSFLGFKEQLVLYTIFLVSITIGSVLFYDLPLSGNNGFRNYLGAKGIPSFRKELWLVVIWSSILSLSGFLLMQFANNAFFSITKEFHKFIWPLLKQTGLCIGLTTLSVGFFLLAFPDQPKFDTARGIVAGLFLRIALFFGLLFYKA